jgi:hypothetical protein
MIDSATRSFLGEAQIHAENFRATNDVEKTIININWEHKRLKASTASYLHTY